jgi:hypothetical protein
MYPQLTESAVQSVCDALRAAARGRMLGGERPD